MIFEMRFLTLLSLFLICGVRIGTAQTPPDTLEAELDPVQINAIHTTISREHAPLSLSVSSRTLPEINAEAALTLDNITNRLPGIWIKDRENYALGESILIRGLGWRAAFGVRGIQVIMDDIPLTVADGQSMLTSVDPAFISNIELIRGPASAYWGNSSGGVMYLSTPSPAGDSPTVRVRSLAGSYGLIKEELHLTKSTGSHKVTGYTSYLSEDGYRDHSYVKMSRTGLKGSIDLNSDSRLEYMGAFVAMPQAQHPSGLTAGQVEENPRQANSAFKEIGAGKEVYQGQAGLSYYRNSSAGFLTLTGYGIYRDLSNPLTYGIIDVDRWAGGLRGTLDRELGNVSLSAGFDTKWQHDGRKEYDNNDGSRGAIQVNQLEKVNNQALFATTALKLQNFSLLGGLRFDRLTFNTDAQTPDASGKRIFYALSPSIGLAYTTGGTKFYSNLSTSFEAPTTTELVNRPDGGNGFNPELKPERTVGLEAGVRGTLADQDVATFDVALYQLWVQDLLFPYQLEANGPTFYRNQGETRHSGIEGRITIRPLPNISSGLTYNYTRARFLKAQTLDSLSLQGKSVPGIPKHRLMTHIAYISSSLLFDLSYEYVGSLPVNNLNTAENGSYGLVNSRISLLDPFKSSRFGVQPFLNVNNIFDVRYNGSVAVNTFGDRYYEPSAGRNWQMGVAVEFY